MKDNNDVRAKNKSIIKQTPDFTTVCSVRFADLNTIYYVLLPSSMQKVTL